MLLVILLTIGGFVGLIAGANFLIDGAASVGKRLKVSSMVIGFTIVATGTSLPELIINIFAGLRNQSDLAISNVIGSNIMNTLLVIGASAAIFPIAPGRRSTYQLLPISLLAALLILFLSYTSIVDLQEVTLISRNEGIFLLVLLAGYIWFLRYFNKNEEASDEAIPVYSWLKSVLMILAGVAGLYFGGLLVIEGVSDIMERYGLSQAIVGITIIAVLTSLPELITSIMAALKKTPSIAFGNAIGSNIVNVFMVLGITAVVRPLAYSSDLHPDVFVMAASNLIIYFMVIIGKGFMINRLEGILLIIIYAAYIAQVILRG